MLQLADNCEFESQSSQSHDAITPLVATLAELAADRTRVAERAGQRSADQRGAGSASASEVASTPAEVLIAAGRNRHASEAFFSEAAELFDVKEIAREELDPIYQCEDVAVWRLSLKLAEPMLREETRRQDH